MNKKLIRKMQTASGGPIKYISDMYLKLSDSPIASTVYDGINLALYAASPFTGGTTLIPAMAMTGLQATGASANIYDKGLNSLNGIDIASAIPGFGLLNKGVKLAMKPTMKIVGKTTKRVKNATKYLPKKESHPYTYRRMERVGNSGSRRVIRPVEHTIELGRYHPTFWLLAKEDKKYWPAAVLVYGEDAINHGLNTYLVIKDIDLKKQGGKMNILEFLKNGNKIKKAQLGTDLNVDTRSDTTRQGYNERGMSSALSHNYFPLLDFYNAVEEISLTSNNPYLNTGIVYTPSKADRIWKFLHDFVKKNPKVLSSPTVVSKGMIPGNEITVGQVKQPLTGLTVRNNTPLALENTVMNPAEKAAAEDYLASRNLKNFEEFPDVTVNTKLPTGRPTGDYKYPKEIMEKYGFDKPKVVLQQLTTKPVSKTASQRSKEYYSKKKEDKDNGISKKRSRLVLNNKALTTGDMRAANMGRPRKAARNIELEKELKKDNGYWGREFNKMKLKVALGKQGSELKYKNFLDSYWNYKLKGILSKEKFGGILNFYKKGGGIHIKEKNKGKFTDYCGGKVTDECILKGKNSSNPVIRKRATFADNARHFKHLNGGIIKAYQGTKTTTGLNSDLGLAIVNGGLNLLQTGILLNELTNAQSDASKIRNKLQWNQVVKLLIKQNLNDINNQYLHWVYDYLSGRLLDRPNLMVAKHMGYLLLSLDLAEGKDDLDYQNSLIDYQTRLKTAQNWGNAIEGVLQEGLKSLSSYLNNKTSTNSSTANSSTVSSPTTNSFWITPSLTKSFLNNSSLT